jgi:hypothetical protein
MFVPHKLIRVDMKMGKGWGGGVIYISLPLWIYQCKSIIFYNIHLLN